ncbi:MAG: HNH endonuclease [Acidobacteriia bacterium]|nr:HNH endonuclease [Terriglobia bacterium]
MNPLPIPQPEDGKNVKSVRSKRNKNQKQNAALAARLAAMHGYICWYCGSDISNTAPLESHLDHIFPISAGGTNHDSNRALVCEVCDRAKWNMPLSDFLKWLHRPKKSIYTIPQS